MDIVTTGLAQIPRDGLERLIAHIDADGPVLLTGGIYGRRTGHG